MRAADRAGWRTGHRNRRAFRPPTRPAIKRYVRAQTKQNRELWWEARRLRLWFPDANPVSCFLQDEQMIAQAGRAGQLFRKSKQLVQLLSS